MRHNIDSAGGGLPSGSDFHSGSSGSSGGSGGSHSSSNAASAADTANLLALLSVYEARGGTIAGVASILFQVSSILFALFAFFLFQLPANGGLDIAAFEISLLGMVFNILALFTLMGASKAGNVREAKGVALSNILSERLGYVVRSAKFLSVGRFFLLLSLLCMVFVIGAAVASKIATITGGHQAVGSVR